MPTQTGPWLTFAFNRNATGEVEKEREQRGGASRHAGVSGVSPLSGPRNTCFYDAYSADMPILGAHIWAPGAQCPQDTLHFQINALSLSCSYLFPSPPSLDRPRTNGRSQRSTDARHMVLGGTLRPLPSEPIAGRNPLLQRRGRGQARAAAPGLPGGVTPRGRRDSARNSGPDGAPPVPP